MIDIGERRSKKRKNMKLNFQKISAVGTSAILATMTMGIAAAASFPAPFVASGSTGTGVVYGASADALDSTQANSIANYIAGELPSTGVPTGGDSVLLAKSSDNLNLGDTWSVFTGSVDEDDLSTLLADGTYVADDNDEFDYEQKISLGTPNFTHFRDSDYESAAGLDERTPTLGFKIGSNTMIANYTLDFTSDAETDIDTNARAEDIEGSDLPILGKTYYVSELKNGTSADSSSWGKMTLLDSASIGQVSEGETVTVNGHQVSIDFIDNDEVVYMVDGQRAPSSGKLQKGGSFKLDGGDYIGVRDISRLEVSGESGSTSFSIGSGKLEITHGADIKLNDDTINGLTGWLHRSGGSTSFKLNKVIITWTTDEEVFLSPGLDLVMPGFDAIKFSMNDLVRPTEEKISVERDGDTSIELSAPIKDGDVNLNLVFANTTGDLIGLGKDAGERLLTSNTGSMVFTEKNSSGDDYDAYFVASYNVTSDAESYLLRARVTTDTDAGRNETDIQKMANGAWIDACEDKIAGDTCDVGDVSITIGTINYTAGGTEDVVLTVGTNVNFHTLFTEGGLKMHLPYVVVNGTTGEGAINVSDTGEFITGTTGHGTLDWDLSIFGEDKDDNIAPASGGTAWNITLNDNSDNNLQVQNIDGSGTGGANGKEVGDTSVYESYTNGAVPIRILHSTKADEDSLEIYYPEGDSETYAEVYLTETGTTGASGADGGSMVFMDSEKPSWESRDVVLVGGSCINTATADALNVAAGTCGDAFTSATGIGSGQYLIQSVGDAFTSGNIALVVAGYSKDDTAAAASRLITLPTTVDTTAGKKYLGVVGVKGMSKLSEI